jgi:hypothetical protein
LKLSAQHIPIPGSIATIILQRFADTTSSESAAEALTAAEILNYVQAHEDGQTSLLQQVHAGAKSHADQRLPNPEHTALIQWIDAALDLFQVTYALEPELQDRVTLLTPALLKEALLDPDFTVPGVHPMHQLLDQIQASGVGWQTQIGRAAAAYTDLIDHIVQSVADCQNDDLCDLSALVTEIETAHQKDQQRADKMVQRVIDQERGRLKNLTARAQAARMINEKALNKRAPVQISQFLTGDWYDSAQLVLLKFGDQSAQWEELQQTTETLLRSVQPFAEGGAGSRQELFELVTQIPKALRQWLVSVQHDSEALESAIGLVETVHMGMLRQQEPELVAIAKIETPEYEENPERGAHFDTISTLRTGQWLALKIDDDWLRAQLCMNTVATQHLLFCNRLGMKNASLSYSEFAHLINTKAVRSLEAGKAFSLCLVRAAGVTDTDQLEQAFSTDDS